MRLLLLTLIVFLGGCERVNDEEMLFVGRWSWHVEEEGFGESGFLELRENRTYSYLVEWWNPTERLGISALEKDHFSWRLNNDSICVAKIIESGNVKEEDCLWHVRKDKSGTMYLAIESAVVSNEVTATRKK